MYLDISAQTWKKLIGIQKNPMNIPNTSINLKIQPPSWMTEAQVFLGRIANSMIRWKINRAKVILSTAEIPKHAELLRTSVPSSKTSTWPVASTHAMMSSSERG